MGYFPTGVTIVTSWRGDEPVGATINAFCSVSLDPPMLLICLNKANPLCEPVQTSRRFGVNILGHDGDALARHFAVAPEDERFTVYPYRATDGGAPQLNAAPVFVDCAVESIHLAGDHFILTGRGLRTEHVSAEPPLLYHRGNFPKLWPAT
jgi:3-hydroxy-9,10-secoandrosta-1,3,5(10)-triene-9,17-dione monooxygenase reductase component